MVNQTASLMDILHDVLLTVRLDDKERFRQMALEEKARAEQKLVPAGHQVVNLRLRSHFGEAHWAAEQMGGISHLFFLRELIDMIEKNWPNVLAALEEMRRLLVNRRAMIFNITLDKKSWPGFERQIHQALDAMPDAPVDVPDWVTQTPPLFEGMTLPSQVNYVGKGANLFELGYRFHGSTLVIARYLRNSYLWDRIRVQGGAYGAFCLFDRLSGVLSFVSYRDPNLIKTIEAFDNTAAFLRDLELDDQELTKSIIGAIGDLDTHMLPDVKGYTSLLRYLSHDTEAMRQQLRDEVLATGKDDFRAFGTLLEEVERKGVVKVLGSQDAIDAAVSERPGWLSVLKVL
jgi:Zn-dependent M16 (insulinase) family peptidase